MERDNDPIPETSPPPDLRKLAGEFSRFAGTLSKEEAAEMQALIDEAFETISEDW